MTEIHSKVVLYTDPLLSIVLSVNDPLLNTNCFVWLSTPELTFSITVPPGDESSVTPSVDQLLYYLVVSQFCVVSPATLKNMCEHGVNGSRCIMTI